ncbi:MAG: glycosyltransferase family 2 protein [Verrucomicrobiota bacterium]
MAWPPVAADPQDMPVANSMNQLESMPLSAASGGDVEYSDHSKLPAEPLVSVFMITYQHASFIKEAIDSVLMQNVDFPYEICIGEDGSTDGTREICIEYARKHPDKIRLFLRNRSNPARNNFAAPYMFNTASTFDACRGKYIALLEGDDYWLNPHKLQTQVNQLEADSGLAASCHYAACLQEEKPWIISVTPTQPVESFTIDAILRRDVGNIHTSTWLLRRGKPMPWEKFRSSRFGDYPIIVCAMLQGTARTMPRIWSMYRIHAGGVFSPNSGEARLQWNVELWKCLESILPPSLQSACAIGVSRTLAMLTGAFSKTGKYGPALRCFRTNLSEIARNRSSAPDRGQLRWRALESLLLPHAQGMRNRWNARKF